MLKMTKSTVAGGVACLLLVNTIISAEKCDLSLSRSACGRVTRIESGDNYAVIQYNPDNTWKAYTVNSGRVTVSDSSDTTPSYGKQFDSQLQDSSLEQNLRVSDGESLENSAEDVSTPETTDTNSAELQKLLSSPLLGARFSSESGRLLIDSSNGAKLALKSDNGQHTIYGDPQGNTMAALNLNNASKYSNILLQNGTLATFVSRDSCQIETLPLHKLSYDQAAEVSNLKSRAMKDNSHGRGPNMMPPPPPPPRPFSPFNSFGPQYPFQQQQQSSYYQPRQFLRIIPFRGLGQ